MPNDNEMDAQDWGEAAKALVNWLRSQDIPPADAVTVMVLAITAILKTGPKHHQPGSVAAVVKAMTEILDDSHP